MLNDDMVCDLIGGLRQIFKTSLLQIILYGSVARKEQSQESDIDIAIIIRDNQILGVLDHFVEWNAELDMKYERVFSIVDIEESKMKDWGDILPFYKNIRQEGIVLWKAA